MTTALIKKIVKKAEELPAMPGVVTQVLEITSDKNFSMNHLIKVISLDAGITAKVLKVANSPFFALRNKATSLQVAVPQLGSQNVVEIALGMAVSPMFARSQEGYQLEKGQLWRHSMATALVASWLCKKLSLPDQPTIFTAALLHDVGKMILSEFVSEKNEEINLLVNDEGWHMCDAEKRVLGVDHPGIGAYVAKKWHLGQPIKEAVFYHHQPAEAPKPRHITNAVALANFLAVNAGEKGGMSEAGDEPPQVALWELNIYPQQVEEMIESCTALLEKAEPLLAMAG